jgi:endonuclease-3 related protein
LYAGRYPIFVVDAYTVRVLQRHGWMKAPTRYEAVQQLFHTGLPLDVGLFNEFHALVVRVGKEYCRSKPRCDGCPLQPLLPVTGPCAY